jgi:hypothetical protein
MPIMLLLRAHREFFIVNKWLRPEASNVKCCEMFSVNSEVDSEWSFERVCLRNVGRGARAFVASGNEKKLVNLDEIVESTVNWKQKLAIKDRKSLGIMQKSSRRLKNEE